MSDVPPKMKHQIEACNFIRDKSFSALFMEQGTGKSKVAIDHTEYLFQEGEIDTAIIISPNAVKEQWINEQFPTHYAGNNWTGIIWDGCKTKKAKQAFEKIFLKINNLFVFSVNVEAFQAGSIDEYIYRILKERFPIVIIDESTKIKNGRRKTRSGKRAGAKRTNKILDMFEGVKHKMILTGTPTPNNPFDLWAQFEFLKKDYFGMDFFFFQHCYGIMIKKKSNKGHDFQSVLDEKEFNIIKARLKKLEKISAESVERISGMMNMKTKDILLVNSMEKYTGFKNVRMLRNKIIPVTFFVKKKDCLDLPDKVYETLLCEMGTQQKKAYNSLKKQMYADYQDREITVTNKLVLTLRLQMITGGLFPFADTEVKLNGDGEAYEDTKFRYQNIVDNGKIKVLTDDLEEVDRSTSVIIWARFRGEIDFIYDKLIAQGETCGKYYGGSSPEIIEEFKRGDIRFLIANPQKGGEGLNLQIATLHYFWSLMYKADTMLQAEDRSHRIGQTNKVTYKFLLCRGTVDELIYAVLKRKENLINYFRANDGRDFLETL